MTSLRRALTARLLLTLGVTMAVIALALFLGVRAALIRQFDATLLGRAAAIEAATRWDGHKIDLDFVGAAMPWYAPGPDAEYFEIRAVQSSPALAPATSPSLASTQLAADAIADETTADVRLPDGRAGRVHTHIFRPPPDEEFDPPERAAERAQAAATMPTLRLAVAMSRAHLDATLQTIAIALALAGAAMAATLAIGVRVALRSGLAPLTRLSTQISRVRADTLSTRLPADHIPEELRPIHARLNELIERLDIAFARERRFTSAAAHELRTPVAELRSLLEVSLSRPRTAESARESAEEALAIAVRMDQLVASLLALLRAPRPAAGPLPAVPLEPLLNRLIQQYQPAAERRAGSITFTTSTETARLANLSVRADPAALESILTNILSNAVAHASPTPDIRCTLTQQAGDHLLLEVSNPAKGLTPADAAHFFEPFWRKSDSRTDQSHLGLGLTVARALAERMGAELSATVATKLVTVRLVVREADRAESPAPIPVDARLDIELPTLAATP